MIKFNKFNVTDGTLKAKVFYSLDNRIDGRKCVTIYAEDWTNNLQQIFRNESKALCYLGLNDKRKVNLFECHPLYSQARALAESIK